MAFAGPAPETINGRLAMVGVIGAIFAEFATGLSVSQQFWTYPVRGGGAAAHAHAGGGGLGRCCHPVHMVAQRSALSVAAAHARSSRRPPAAP